MIKKPFINAFKRFHLYLNKFACTNISRDFRSNLRDRAHFIAILDYRRSFFNVNVNFILN